MVRGVAEENSRLWQELERMRSVMGNPAMEKASFMEKAAAAGLGRAGSWGREEVQQHWWGQQNPASLSQSIDRPGDERSGGMGYGPGPPQGKGYGVSAGKMLQNFLDSLGGMMAPGAAGVPLRQDQQGAKAPGDGPHGEGLHGDGNKPVVKEEKGGQPQSSSAGEEAHCDGASGEGDADQRGHLVERGVLGHFSVGESLGEQELGVIEQWGSPSPEEA